MSNHQETDKLIQDSEMESETSNSDALNRITGNRSNDNELRKLIFFIDCLSVIGHRSSLDVQRLTGAIEDRLSHFLPR